MSTMDLIFFIFFRYYSLKYKQGEVNMRTNKKRRNRNNEDKKPKKVIRCKALNRPVFVYEGCSKFSSKINSNNQKICVNCAYSF
jgi:hypothetical protein